MQYVGENLCTKIVHKTSLRRGIWCVTWDDNLSTGTTIAKRELQRQNGVAQCGEKYYTLMKCFNGPTYTMAWMKKLYKETIAHRSVLSLTSHQSESWPFLGGLKEVD